jgi:dTDP-D-glucose 4,6-dehydratase
MGYEVFNLGNGRPYLLSDFISLVERCVGKRANIHVMPMQPGDVDRTCADISKAQRLLGYNPQTPFEVGIARTADWYKEAFEQGMFDENPEPHFPVAPDPVRRQHDDLELSSAVEKAPMQVRQALH